MTTPVQEFKPTLPQRLSHLLYSVVLSIVTLFAVIVFLLKNPFKDKNFRKRKLQRFGLLPKINPKGGIMLHCVSVGEVVAASAIVKRIQNRHPEYPHHYYHYHSNGSRQSGTNIRKQRVTFVSSL